jgi:hypothetical protein
LPEPIRLIPIPWVELTGYTEEALPAVATGIQFDLGLIFIGMVLPFWAVIGGFIGLIITVVANPLLYHAGVLTRWHPGMRTVDTVFANNFDFYMSFGIAWDWPIAVVGIYYVLKSFGKTQPGRTETGQPAGPAASQAGPGRFQYLDFPGNLRVFDPGVRGIKCLAGSQFPLGLLFGIRLYLHAHCFLYHRAYGGDRRAVREPAAGAGGELHCRCGVSSGTRA